jgi:Ca2+-binding EF-hand superfamily protein
MYIVSSLPSHKLEEERKEFIKMDENKDGYISITELENAVAGMKDKN